MAFIAEAEFTLHSVIDNLDDAGIAEGEPEISITTVRGFIRHGEGELTLSYTESGEGGRCACEVILSEENRVLIKRRGAIECDMLFAEGEERCTVYSVPPYSFDMLIRTKRIRSTLTSQGGELYLLYSMNVGGQEKNVRMRVNAKRL